MEEFKQICREHPMHSGGCDTRGTSSTAGVEKIAARTAERISLEIRLRSTIGPAGGSEEDSPHRHAQRGEGRRPMNEQWRTRITIEPGKRGGRPCIRGMRITVYDVLAYLAAGMTVDEVLDDFPYLEPEDIQACFAYAAERERSMLVAVK